MSISISAYSVLASVIVFNVGFMVLVLLRNRTLYLQKYEVESLIVLSTLSVIRLIFPLDTKYAMIFNSEFLIPEIQKLLKTPIIEGMTWGSFLLGVWGSGVVIKFVHTISVSYKTIAKVQRYIKIDCPQINRLSKLPQYKKVTITVTPEILTPIVTGILHPHIFLPVLDVTDIELDMILKHEIQHVKNGDLITKGMFSILEAVFWWNPFIDIFVKELENILELYCDKSVTDKMSRKQREIYCLTLIKVLKQAIKRNENYGLMVSGFSKINRLQIVKQRMEMVLDRNKEVIMPRKLLVTGFFIFIFILSYLFIIQPRYNISIEDAKEIVEVNSKNAYIKRSINGTITLIINGEKAHELSEQDIGTEPYNSLNVIEETCN